MVGRLTAKFCLIAAWIGWSVLAVKTIPQVAATEMVRVWDASGGFLGDTNFFSRFSKESGIEVRVTSFASPVDLTARLEATFAAGYSDLDVVVGLSSTILGRFAEEGFFQPIQAALPDWSLRLSDDRNVPPRWVAIRATPTVLCVSRDEPDPPKTWLELASNRFERSVVVPDPRTSAMGYVTLTGWLNIFNSNYQNSWARDAHGGWEIIDRIDRNTVAYTQSPWDSCKRAAFGRIAVGVSSLDIGAQLVAEGAPIELVVPSEGTPMTVLGAAILRGALDSENGEKLIGWMTSDGSSEIFGRIVGKGAAVRFGDEVQTIDGNSYAGFLDKAASRLSSAPWGSEWDPRRVLTEWSARYDAKAER